MTNIVSGCQRTFQTDCILVKKGCVFQEVPPFIFPPRLGFSLFTQTLVGGKKIGGFILVTGTLETKRIKWPSLCLEVTVYCLKLKLGCQYAFITRTVFQQGLVSLIMA